MSPGQHRTSSPADTHQRIVEAAARVFARRGLAGSTTREIAEEAGVNEVTLFRHFQTKDKLLEAVVGQNFGTAPLAEAPTPATSDLRADLLEHGRRYEHLLRENLPLVRTMLGEIQHRHRDQEKQVFNGIFRPIKAAILARLEAAHRAGALRSDVRPDLVADLFGGMIFTGVLRRASPESRLEYSASSYLENAVDVLLQGAAAERARNE